ncbi:supervillin-like [Anoplophora glabripennis]|uniref:supervillin-like n=1 Tax=Anoplophora glabripennis TaxID=217634 RepID=UPI000873C6EF|nr:supervillin-like [Anoplophora glabripennis]
MNACNVKEMLKNFYEDPCFFVDFHNVGRGIIGDGGGDKNQSYIKSTKALNCWRIIGDELQKVEDTNHGILYDTETYILQWKFEYVADGTTHEDTLFYYWKGKNASKGHSPLPPEIEDKNPAVERICQWSEPALFFHMFSKRLIVFNGTHDKFNPNLKRLFMVRGELPSEIHLYEVPCSKESLRSRGIFLLLNTSENMVYYWFGAAVPSEHQQIGSKIKLNTRNEHWANYGTVEVKDGYDDLFLKLLGDQTSSYVRFSSSADFSPRLFYFSSITGNFLAIEVEYPLRSKRHKAAFPFLQSHLYTADQPALFLLDNGKEIWLWEGWKTSESSTELFEIELQLAKETASNYAKEKGHNLSIPVKHVLSGLEPLEFVNIFPYWNKRNDIAEVQLKNKH